MCGIFGYASTKEMPQLDRIAIELAKANTSRGRCSWGVTDGKRIIKDTGALDDNLHRVPFGTKGILLGHTRAATVGAVTKENAHPFHFKAKSSIIGVHNGSVSNWSDLNAQFNRKLEVDSMQIFKHLAEHRPMTEINGHGAIVFFEDGKLFFSKFNHGSLSIATVEGYGCVWSSTESDLFRALKTWGYGRSHKMYNLKDGDLYFLGADDGLYDSSQTMPISASYASSTTEGGRNVVGFRGHHAYNSGTYRNREELKTRALNARVLIRITLSGEPPEPPTTPSALSALAATEEKVTELVARVLPPEPTAVAVVQVDEDAEIEAEIKRDPYFERKTGVGNDKPCFHCDTATDRRMPICTGCVIEMIKEQRELAKLNGPDDQEEIIDLTVDEPEVTPLPTDIDNNVVAA